MSGPKLRPVYFLSVIIAMLATTASAAGLFLDNLYHLYLFGAAFNSFFLIYAALFTLSMLVLILGLATIDANSISQRFCPERLLNESAATCCLWRSVSARFIS